CKKNLPPLGIRSNTVLKKSLYTFSCLPSLYSSNEQKCSNAPTETTASNVPKSSGVTVRQSLILTLNPFFLQALYCPSDNVRPKILAPLSLFAYCKKGPHPEPISRTLLPS